jgi:molecular chaperone GrpE
VENEKNTQTAQSAEPTEPKAPAAEQPKEEKKARKSAKTADLEAKLEAVQQELEATRDQYQRMLAEYANYKRRTEQEKEQIGAFTKAELLTGLLVSVDNMEKAMASEDGDNYKAGVDLVMRQFMEALAKLGLEKIEALGAPFDPNVHNAVMREDADGVEQETVTAVFQEGYKVGGRVLRPAMVKVAN